MVKAVRETVTLRDVAERAGVSITTVSRILNGQDTGVPVRDETRSRILTAASDLGYKPNLLARALRGSRSSLLGVIVRDISDPFHVQVLRGVNEVARKRGYRLFLGHVDWSPDVAAVYGSMFEQSHADGILVLGDIAGGDATLDDLANHHEHVVGVSDRVGPRPVPGVYVDNRAGTRPRDGAPLAARPSDDHLRRRRTDGRRPVPGERLRGVHAGTRRRRSSPRLLHDAARLAAELPPGPPALRPPRSRGPPDGGLRRVRHDRDRAASGGVPGECRRAGPDVDRRFRRHRHRHVHDPATHDDQPVRRRDGPRLGQPPARPDRGRGRTATPRRTSSSRRRSSSVSRRHRPAERSGTYGSPRMRE